jgi:hypothetical protein
MLCAFLENIAALDEATLQQVLYKVKSYLSIPNDLVIITERNDEALKRWNSCRAK